MPASSGRGVSRASCPCGGAPRVTGEEMTIGSHDRWAPKRARVRARAHVCVMSHHQPVDYDQLQPAYDVVARQVAAGDLPAAALAVADRDGLVRVGAFAPGRERITPLSHFMIASMTKPIMATAVMRLVESGRLDLDVPVQRYLPEFAPLPARRGEPGGETITARDVLRAHGRPDRGLAAHEPGAAGRRAHVPDAGGRAAGVRAGHAAPLHIELVVRPGRADPPP